MKSDHVVMLTTELESLAAEFEKLGFTLTPVGDHGPVFGTANRCVTFADHYVEVIGIRAETQANAPLRGFLPHSAAVSMVSLLSEDIDATHRDLQERGLTVQPPFHISRQMSTPDGSVRPLEFSVLTPMLPVEVPPFFTMRKDTAAMSAPQWRAHANGATRLSKAEIEVHDPKGTAVAYEQLGASVRVEGERRIVAGGDPTVALAPIGSVDIGPRVAPSERYSVLTFVVAGLDATRRALSDRKVAFRDVAGAIVTEIAGSRRCAVRFTAG
jgi:hypothetical protein